MSNNVILLRVAIFASTKFMARLVRGLVGDSFNGQLTLIEMFSSKKRVLAREKLDASFRFLIFCTKVKVAF